MASLPAVVEVFSPMDGVICFRVPEDEPFHEERCSKTAILIRRSRLIIPETSSPLLCNLSAVFQGFVNDIDGDIPLTRLLLRLALSNKSRGLEVIKQGRIAIRDSGKRETIRDRRSLPIAV